MDSKREDFPTCKNIPAIADFPIPSPTELENERREAWNKCKEEAKKNPWSSPTGIWVRYRDYFVVITHTLHGQRFYESVDFGFNKEPAKEFYNLCKDNNLNVAIDSITLPPYSRY